jgi:hypothetical protein
MDPVTADIDTLWHFARPLPPDRRDEFCRAVQDALNRLSCPGPGSAHRALAELLSRYFIPIPDSGIPPHHRRPSKLIDAAPIG